MTDVKISYSVLNELNGSLKQIIVELEEASNRASALEDAIGDPCGRNDLREAAEEFEDGWDDRRKFLEEDIAEVQKHVEEIGKAWAEWDTEAAASLAVEANEAATLPGAK
jgi:DNA repair exonuclease SbcCD ATPase subunit